MKKIFKILVTFAIAIVVGNMMANLVMADSHDQTPQAFDQRAIVAEGRFENQPANEGGLLGAPWRLYSDGVLVVDEGFINWEPAIIQSPWHAHQANINRIQFTSQITAGTSLKGLFGNLYNVTEIEGLENFDMSNVTSMLGMFAGASQLTSLDLSNWDNTSNVINVGGMFLGASQLTYLDVSNLITSSATEMSFMFANASRLTNLNVSNWDTSSVVNMSGMFLGASQLTYLDVSNWITSNVTEMFWMFYGANQLESLNMSNWNTSSVMNMNNMFSRTSSLRTLELGEEFAFVGSVGLPAIRRTAEFTGYWQNVGDGTIEHPNGNYVLTSNQLVMQFDGSNMADIWVRQQHPPGDGCDIIISEGQFSNQVGVNGIEGASWVLCGDRTLKVGEGYINWIPTNHNSPWGNYSEDINVIKFTGAITAGTSLNSLFRNLRNVTTIEGLENFNTSNVTTMPSLFSGASSLESLNLLTWNTSNVTNMHSLFAGASSLESLDLSTWDTSNVIAMWGMFASTSSLEKLDLSTWNTSNVAEWGMDRMFLRATSLKNLRLGADFDFASQQTIDSWTGESRFLYAGLPEVKITTEFTGYWQNVGDGTVDNPTGEFVFTSAQLMEQFDGTTMGDDTWVWQPVRPAYDIVRLSIGGVAGVIDQEAHTITFTVPEESIDGFDQFRGYITELEASSDTLVFFAGGQDWPIRSGESAGVSTGVTVRAEGGTVVYTIIVAHPARSITSFSIGGVAGVIDQEAATITFTVPELDDIGQFRGEITELEADSSTIIFYAGGTDWPMGLGDEAGVSTGVTVRVDGGIVYTIRIIIEQPVVPIRTITNLSVNNIAGVIDQEEHTITFTVPRNEIVNGRFEGIITELVAEDETIYFWVANQAWPRRQGESAGFSTGDEVFVADGIRYRLVVEPAEGLIRAITIGSHQGVVNQERATITFSVETSELINGQLRGVITELDADEDTVIFTLAASEWPLSLGDTAAIGPNSFPMGGFDMRTRVFVEGGRVYTILLNYFIIF